jgi:hypothetical protein
MKRWLVSGLAVSFAACTPSVPTGTNNSSKYVEAEFDPAHSIIPLPNDLAFIDPATGQPDTRLHAPTTGGTDAQNEFNRDYLNLLDGFPMDSTASVLFDKPIDLSSVNAGSVPVLDITNSSQPVPGIAVVYPTTGTSDTLIIGPPAGGWVRGHRYAMAVIGGGGAGAVKGASGTIVTGSPTWALVSQDKPLIICDANGANCVLQTSAIPSTSKDPATAQAEQIALAKQLEALRLNYAPLIAALSGPPLNVNPANVALVWTFTITSQAEVTFDPVNFNIPFPNDVLLNPDGGLVNIPKGVGLPDALVDGLNTLDGFSTTAMIVSEFGPDTGPLLQGRLPGTNYTLSPAGPINMVQAALGKGARPAFTDGSVSAHACVNCPPITVQLPDGGPILLPDGGLKPDTLAIVPDVPLTERTQYAVYITTDLKDINNKPVIPSPIFALARSSAPLVSGGKSTVSVLSDAQAALLDQLRVGLKPLFDELASQGLPRKKVALAWAFTTQTAVSALEDLHLAPGTAGLPTAPPYVTGAFSAAIKPVLGGQGIPTGSIDTIFLGSIVDLFALTSAFGTFDPGLSTAHPQIIPFVMTSPKVIDPPVAGACSTPANGFPVTIFGHGLTGNRTNAYAIANALASFPSCQVMIAIDETWHGERNTCTGFGHILDLAAPAGAPHPDNLACANPGTMACSSGRCVADAAHQAGRMACVPGDQTNGDALCLISNQGTCVADGKCEGGTFGSSLAGIPISGWNLINFENFFATRDNLRQQVISNAQLIRVLQGTGATSLSQRSVKIDPTRINYGGQSLGGILGAISMAVAPEVNNVMLNVPGADPELIILISPSFDAQKQAFIGGLAAQGVPFNSPSYDTFLGIIKWIIDPADPANAAFYLSNHADIPQRPPNIGASRRTFVQWIVGDGVVPNPSTVELVRAAVADPNATGLKLSTAGDTPFWAYQFSGTSTPLSFNEAALPACLDPANHPGNRHPFLLRPPSATCGGPPSGTDGVALTGNAQSQAVGFLIGAPPFP